MVRISEHRLILNSQAGVKDTASPYGVRWNLQNFFTQFPRQGAGTKYKLGVDFFHFGTAINNANKVVNIVMDGFVQNKNRTYLGTLETNSNIIASIIHDYDSTGHVGGHFTFDRDFAKMSAGFFSSNGNVKVWFVDDSGAVIDWSSTTNNFQLNLIIEAEYED
jgi:hypothetical protein